MKTIVGTLAVLALTTFAHAADPLHGTFWRTIDDETKRPKALVKFTQTNDVLNAHIQKILTPGEEQACTNCEGKYHNVSLVGVKIVSHLKPLSASKYAEGMILNPKNGKSYKLKAQLSADGKTLNLVGSLGPFQRTQVWERVDTK